MMANAYEPVLSTTIAPGRPLRMQTSLAVSFGEFEIAETCPLFRVKLKVSSTADPWLPTITSPSDEAL
jgi:hypothetical protein